MTTTRALTGAIQQAKFSISSADVTDNQSDKQENDGFKNRFLIGKRF